MQIYMRVGGGEAEENATDNTPIAPLVSDTLDRRGKRTSISLPPPLKLPLDIGGRGPSNDTPTSRRAPTDTAYSERRLSQPQTPAIVVKKNSPFAQMSRDIKLRRIQQQQQELQMLLRQGRKSGKGDNYFRRGEECYTDKDRAAAVNMGTRDIKLSLKLKRRQERSKALQIPEQAEPGTLLALGGHEMKGGDLRVALSFVNKALELQPSDKHALVARSKCHLLLGLAHEALQDADAALAQDKAFVKAIFQKAEALYHLGDFEHSLMFYHRGLRLRPELAGFRLGVQKAQEAIENTIGKGCCSRLNMIGPSSSVADMSGMGVSNPATHRSSTAATPLPPVTVPTANLVHKSSSARQGSAVQSGPRASSGHKSATSSSGDSLTSAPKRHLLGQLSIDKSYLESLLQHPDMKASHQEGVKHIATHAEEGLAFLKRRQEFWRQQCPNTPLVPGPKIRISSEISTKIKA
ncbi:hypothetical protein B566_EDAN002671 [Ephemera danica]|nr:hypothetical protein B566_EDAN002671 [Ephemera danica]